MHYLYNIIIFNGNNALINNNYIRFQSLILLFGIPTSTRKNFFEIHRQFAHAPSDRQPCSRVHPPEYSSRTKRTEREQWGMRWRSFLRRFATSQEVAGSIPDGVIGIFHWHPSGRAVALGVDSASNRNEYLEYFLGGKGGRCVRLTTLSPSYADFLEIWEPQPPGTLRACPGL